MNSAGIASAYAQLDSAIQDLVDQIARDGLPIRCARGCFACCHEALWATRMEAEYLLEGLDPTSRLIVAQRTQEWLQAAQKRAPRLLATPVESASQADMQEWLQAQIPCPLLQDGLCRAYSRRPAGCRTFLVISDPRLCGPQRRQEAQHVKTNATDPAVQALYSLVPDDDTVRHLGVHLARILLPPVPIADTGRTLGELAEIQAAKQPDLAGWHLERPR